MLRVGHARRRVWLTPPPMPENPWSRAPASAPSTMSRTYSVRSLAATSRVSRGPHTAFVMPEDVTSKLRADGVSDWLIQAVANMARGNPDVVSGLLVSVSDPIILPGTKTSCRTHFVKKDGNGRARVDALVNVLAQKAVDYCIPRSRINEALAAMHTTGSTADFVRLSEEARSLFTNLATSGEGGELLLYTLLEEVLRIPQIICKMPLKTNSQMHIHGSDGIHGKMLDSGNLALYWGESKLHAKVNSAIDKCFESVGPFLIEGLDGAAQRDLLLVRDNLDTGSEELTAALIRYFSQGTEESAKIEVRAGCLVGFDVDDYPDPLDDSGQAIRVEVQKAIDGWIKRISDKVGTHSLASFEIEIFCVPVPSVQNFRNSLNARLALS